MVFLQLLVNLKWLGSWYKGDMTAAFLQGRPRDQAKLGQLFLVPPSRPLEGVEEGCLLRVLKSVYGLPDAPRAWWKEITQFLLDLGFTHNRLDPAFMQRHNPDTGDLEALVVLHVDDLMIATNVQPHLEEAVQKLRTHYPFGEWVKVGPDGTTKTGRRVRPHGDEILLDQESFITGRMSELPPVTGKPKDALCTPAEIALFRSAVGNLHWVTSQSRPDCAVYTSRAQKVQTRPTYEHYSELARVIRSIRATADQSLRIRPMHKPCLGVWTDSSLFGKTGRNMHRTRMLFRPTCDTSCTLKAAAL
jgi:hypothetical protein